LCKWPTSFAKDLSPYLAQGREELDYRIARQSVAVDEDPLCRHPSQLLDAVDEGVSGRLVATGQELRLGSRVVG
jgi:hypothetical protein